MYNLVPGDAISGSIAFTGFYELNLTQRIVEHAAKGGLLVDVGANMGYFSLLWAGLNRSARVLAFEAAPRNIELFQANVSENQFGDRVSLIPKAAGARPGTAMFEIWPGEETGWGGFSDDPAVPRISVPVVCLDDELPEGRISVLKIDVEGADALVLQGAERLLRDRRIDTIYFEENLPRMQAHGLAAGDIQRLLQGFGYECQFFGDGWVAFPGKD